MNRQFGAAAFDSFAISCKFAQKIEGNGGYGCSHPLQEEKTDDGEGCCFCSSCPLGYEADADDVKNQDINWDNLTPDPLEMEGEYLIVEIGDNAGAEAQEAWLRYQRYLYRYEKDADAKIKAEWDLPHGMKSG